MSSEVKITPDEAIKVMSVLHLGYSLKVKAACDLAIIAIEEYGKNHKEDTPELFPELLPVE